MVCLTSLLRVSADERPVDESPAAPVEMSPQATEFIKGMVLLLLPDSYSDDDDWGQKKKVQSGLNVKVDGLKVQTSRRWKEVNHGLWQRVDAALVDPASHFQLKILLLPRTEPGVPRYRIQGHLRLRAVVRRQRWTLGTKLYSVSADVVADVRLDADLHFRNEVVSQESGNRLRVLPHIDSASLSLQGFSLRSVSHAKGGTVREVGNMFEWIVRRAVRRKGEKLATKLNSKVQKKPERFEIPAGVLGVLLQAE